jgi:glyoxylase-like metal-dependent hydrolase (beta-lactamase superfamily II)
VVQWGEVGDGVFVRRYEFFDQNIGVVRGDGELLVIDTRTTYAQARQLQDDVRALSPDPWIVVNTHHHFDHTFGNALFRPADIWGHERCASILREHGEDMRRRVIESLRDLAGELEEVEIIPPNRLVGDRGVLAVGGRTVELRYLGRAHTDNDLAVIVPDAGVLFAGDLVEQGAPPSFGDSFPLDWPATNRRLLALVRGPVVPGHGDVVDTEFVRAQLADLTEAADAARQGHAGGASIPDLLPVLPFPEPYARQCLERAYAQLDPGH